MYLTWVKNTCEMYATWVKRTCEMYATWVKRTCEMYAKWVKRTCEMYAIWVKRTCGMTIIFQKNARKSHAALAYPTPNNYSIYSQLKQYKEVPLCFRLFFWPRPSYSPPCTF